MSFALLPPRLFLEARQPVDQVVLAQHDVVFGGLQLLVPASLRDRVS